MVLRSAPSRTSKVLPPAPTVQEGSRRSWARDHVSRKGGRRPSIGASLSTPPSGGFWGSLSSSPLVSLIESASLARAPSDFDRAPRAFPIDHQRGGRLPETPGGGGGGGGSARLPRRLSRGRGKSQELVITRVLLDPLQKPPERSCLLREPRRRS